LYGMLAYCDCPPDEDVEAAPVAGLGRLPADEEEMLRSE